MTKEQIKKAKELTEKHNGDIWQIYDEETKTIYQWSIASGSYILEFKDKQL